jgi:plastocyanin
MCHGVGAGASQFPLPPTYTSRSLSPGTVYSVAPGSPGDHTTRSDAAASCEGTGCHLAPGGTVTTTTTPTTTALPVAVTIMVSANSYEPKTVTIAAGGTVTWHNPDHEDVNITSRSELFEIDIPAEGNFKFTFTTPGTYEYFNAEKPTITGVIIVQ